MYVIYHTKYIKHLLAMSVYNICLAESVARDEMTFLDNPYSHARTLVTSASRRNIFIPYRHLVFLYVPHCIPSYVPVKSGQNSFSHNQRLHNSIMVTLSRACKNKIFVLWILANCLFRKTQTILIIMLYIHFSLSVGLESV